MIYYFHVLSLTEGESAKQSMLTVNTPANSRYDMANAICYILVFLQFSSCHRCSFIQMILNPHNQSTKVTKDVLSHLHFELQTLSKPLR